MPQYFQKQLKFYKLYAIGPLFHMHMHNLTKLMDCVIDSQYIDTWLYSNSLHNTHVVM